MAFIRRVKTKSGATAVQIAYSAYGKIIKIEHIGSAHNENELGLLVDLANQQLSSRQSSLFESKPVETQIDINISVSSILLNVLRGQYDRLCFNKLADEDFRNLVIARLVEPSSKLDTPRVLSDLGINDVTKDQLHRCLKRVITNNYRDKLAKLCFAHASKGAGITLVLYDRQNGFSLSLITFKTMEF